MAYITALITLIILELLYFKVANGFNIIDKPNERSSHGEVTLRGGGIIFYFGALFYFVLSGYQYPWFMLGLTLVSGVSFLDDLYNLSYKIRLMIHFPTVFLIVCQLDIVNFPWFYVIMILIVGVGVINAYNFMDGINGMTACYSLVVCFLLLIVNHEINFIDVDLLIYTLLAVSVFTFFNFRRNARCFAGDVGALSIATILLFALWTLILYTNNFIYLLFLTVYGMDVVWTLARRILLKENIFDGHQSHLYQLLGNDAKLNKLAVSFSYAFIQFVIGILTIYMTDKSPDVQFLFAVALIIILSLIYLLIKGYVVRKYVQ